MATIVHRVRTKMAQLSPSTSIAPARAAARANARVAEGLAAQMAVQDWFLAGYFFILTFVVVVFGSGPNHAECMQWVGLDVAIFTAGIILTRGGYLTTGSLAHSLVYRISLFASFLASYFQLRVILPVVTSRAVDGDILSFDLSVFGYEPAVAWDHYVNPHTTEWFAFFYFSYFFLLACHILPMVFGDRNGKRLAHFTLGCFIVYAVGHIGYMIVPGWGPYHYLASSFEHPIEGGLFWHLVKATVDGAGAQKDIFPSLHTAAPTFFAIFSFMHRRSLPFKYTWPIVAFFATQIIGATMFLRWHWLIDVIAGFTLATTAAFVSRAVVDWEWNRRARRGLAPVFEALAWPKSNDNAT